MRNPSNSLTVCLSGCIRQATKHLAANDHRDCQTWSAACRNNPDAKYSIPRFSQKEGERNREVALSTEEAMVLWEKAQAAGYVDANYQSLISRTQAAILADEIAERLEIKEKWKAFETLWNRRNMYRDYHDALNQRQSLQFRDKLRELFR